MSHVVVAAAAFAVAALTLYSGFGLGTLLMPVLALFAPLDAAVAATAVVHLANNVWELALLGRRADRSVALRFGLPAAAAALAGAACLAWIADAEPLARWTVGGRTFEVTASGLVIGLLLAAFAAFDLSPRAARLAFDRRLLPVGGALSGFFGGLSGHQGALRSAFLVKLGLGKEAFLATGAVCAVLVDAARLLVYGAAMQGGRLELLRREGLLVLLATATAAAFLGTWLATRLLPKVTVRGVQRLVGAMLVALGIALAAGIV